MAHCCLSRNGESVKKGILHTRRMEMVMDKLIIPIDKTAVIAQRKQLLKYLYEANDIRSDAPVKKLEEAYRILSVAKGIYDTLHKLDLLPGRKESLQGNELKEDISRIENKINYLMEERRRRRR
jgi:hypothetical protein